MTFHRLVPFNRLLNYIVQYITQVSPSTPAKKIEKDERRHRYIYLTFSMDVSHPNSSKKTTRRLRALFLIFSIKVSHLNRPKKMTDASVLSILFSLWTYPSQIG